MLRKRHFFGALVVFLAVILGGLPGIARASTVAQVSLTETGDYTCVGPCAIAISFSSDGIAHSSSQVFRTMAFSGVGTFLALLPDGCSAQQSYFAFTTQNGKNTLFLSTTSDIFCPGTGNISLETATLTITGGTGIFSSATGAGTANITVLTHPQNATATFNLTITY
jgi:hypothetical protein